jgi:hypothetical protein
MSSIQSTPNSHTHTQTHTQTIPTITANHSIRILSLLHYLTTELSIHQPHNPQQYMIQCLMKLKQQKKSYDTDTDTAATQRHIYEYEYSDNEISTLYDMIDILNQGTITHQQLNVALKQFNCKPPIVSTTATTGSNDAENKRYNRDEFLIICKEQLKNCFS